MSLPEREPAGPTDPGGQPPIRERRAPVSRRRIVSRLWRTAERQVTEIETRMAQAADDPQTLERDAKTLAIIAKTIRDLVAIDTEADERPRRGKCREDSASHGPKDEATSGFLAVDPRGADPGPRDIAEFRAELARRLDELRRERLGDDSP